MSAVALSSAAVVAPRRVSWQKRLSASSRARVARRVVAKATAEAKASPKKHQAEWNSLGSVCAVLGSQWGDEGKGKLVDILAQVSDRAPNRATKPKPRRRTCAMPPLGLPTRTTPHARFRSRSATANRSSTHRPPFRRR